MPKFGDLSPESQDKMRQEGRARRLETRRTKAKGENTEGNVPESSAQPKGEPEVNSVTYVANLCLARNNYRVRPVPVRMSLNFW